MYILFILVVKNLFTVKSEINCAILLTSPKCIIEFRLDHILFWALIWYMYHKYKNTFSTKGLMVIINA